MLNSIDFSGRPFHFIGIGGIGMSALAYVLAQRKLPVSGSDVRLGHITQRLEASGAYIFGKQDASNLELFRSLAKPATTVAAGVTLHASATAGTETERDLPVSQLLVEQLDVLPESALAALSAPAASLSKLDVLPEAAPAARPLQLDVLPELPPAARPLQLKVHDLPQVVCSTAINPANLEYKAALSLGCPIFHRSELLAALIQDYYGIAVAGTHGKTTTSSMIGYLLLQADLDPTIIVGGEVNAWGGNARLGQSQYLVAEADESDGSLVNLSAQIGVVTNIELDHPDHYKTLDEVITTFQVFAQRCQTLVGCIDDATVAERLNPTVSYSLLPETGADYTVTRVTYDADGTTAQIWERGEVLGLLNLPLLGKHNLSNALAAVAVGRLLGLDFPVIAKSLATFEGARRRFELRGEVNDILFIDDYAHHPSEVRATLAAARLQARSRSRIVAIFQPHRYSRTLAFLPDFAQSFDNADLVIINQIYSAGEPNLGQVSGQEVAEMIATYHPNVTYQPTLDSVSQFLIQTLRPGDIALFLGAGDLNKIIPDVMRKISIRDGQNGR
ncbi:MAG: UDP-N-acetylmuramate--L-alanine ligase [Chroococcidiopsidaceae cyanobacterium CP_BM_ER_R8_30]|nr:UDP-N-acetylmuramate--L-alanine ligase [Chroococcidiopsidaceae cyanobacterium CP_BM_ER_R8_30]